MRTQIKEVSTETLKLIKAELKDLRNFKNFCKNEARSLLKDLEIAEQDNDFLLFNDDIKDFLEILVK